MDSGNVQEPRAQRIGPYEVLLDIGSGGMGTISLARATGEPAGVDGFARLVAIKRPHFASAPEREVLARFLDEARLLAQIHHANVVGIHQIGTDAGGHFLVLDYIEGGALDELVSRSLLRRQKLPPPIVLRILGDILAGLHAVHETADVEGRPLGMLHRDVSLENVLIGRDGVARLADFGIAKAIISSTVTDKAYLQGRLQYMAPEYLRRQPVDRRLDVYAAGITMWTALAGRLPFGNAAEGQIVQIAVTEGVPSLSSSGMTIAPGIEGILQRACDRDRDNRFASAREMLDAIEGLGRQTGWIASHAEVATLVEELLGMELRHRRSVIAKRMASLPRSSSPSLPGAALAASPLTTPLPGAPLPAAPPFTAPSTEAQHLASSTPPAPTPAAPTLRAAGTEGPLPAIPGAVPSEPIPISVASSSQRHSDTSPTVSSPAVRDASPSIATKPQSGLVKVALLGFLVVAALGGAVAVWRWSGPDLGGAAGPGPSTIPTSTSATSAQPPSSAAPTSPAPTPSATVESAPSASATATSSRKVVPTGRPSGQSGVPAGLPTGITTSNPYRNKK